MRSEYAAVNRSRVTRPSHLHWRFRVAIGLHQLGVTDMDVYARAFGYRKRGGWDHQKATAFLANCLVSNHPVMRQIIEDGLTIDSGVVLRNGAKARCTACGTNLTEIPCHLCIAKRQEGFRGNLPDSDDGSDEWLEQWFSAEEPAILPHSTDAEPGTVEKVRILASRFRRDELLHHPDDKKVVTGYINPCELRDTVSHNHPGIVTRREIALAA